MTDNLPVQLHNNEDLVKGTRSTSATTEATSFDSDTESVISSVSDFEIGQVATLSSDADPDLFGSAFF